MGDARSARPLLVLAAVLVCPFASSPASGANRFADWAGSGFLGAEFRLLDRDEIYPPGSLPLAHRLDATVAYARDTAWTEARALRQIRRTAAILAGCGIELGSVDLVRLRLGTNMRRLDASAAEPDTGVPRAVAELSAKIPPGARYPVAFLIGRVVGTESLAISYRALEESGPAAPYFDTAWIGYRAHWLPRRDDLYSALAHEIGHLLCRCGHTVSATSHLLHPARNFLSSNVMPQHCEAFIASPLVSASD